ncbi:MAG: hypothetical protein LBT40_11645 [Deltaproteobacteria bacterium]|nr:hypothetical protein [Deltaproteobacteria bacterium]
MFGFKGNVTKCGELGTELPWPVLEMRRPDVVFLMDDDIHHFEFHSKWDDSVFPRHFDYSARLAVRQLYLQANRRKPFRLFSYGIFPGGIERHPQEFFPDMAGEDLDLGCLKFTFIPISLEDVLDDFNDIVEKYRPRIEALVKAGGGDFPLTDAELFELVYAPYGRIRGNPFAVTREYLRQGALLAKYSGNWDLYAIMYLAVKTRGGIATVAMLRACEKEFKRMKRYDDLAQLAEDFMSGALWGEPDQLRAMEEELKTSKSQTEAAVKALAAERMAREAAERKAREAAERKAREAAERKVLAAERKAREAAERKALAAERKALAAERKVLAAERKVLAAERKASKGQAEVANRSL